MDHHARCTGENSELHWAPNTGIIIAISDKAKLHSLMYRKRAISMMFALDVWAQVMLAKKNSTEFNKNYSLSALIF